MHGCTRATISMRVLLTHIDLNEDMKDPDNIMNARNAGHDCTWIDTGY